LDMFPYTDSAKSEVDMFPRTDVLKWHSFCPLKPRWNNSKTYKKIDKIKNLRYILKFFYFI